MEKQEVTFKPTKKQFKAWEYLTDNETREIGFGGAASGGKSYLGCAWVTTICLAYPETTFLIGRKELTNLKRTTILTLFKVFTDFGVTEKDYEMNNQTNILKFSNGSIIMFLDLGYKPSDPLYTRLGGLELTSAFVDESNECPPEAIQILSTRLGRMNNDKYNLIPKLFETFNPSKNHVYTRYYRPCKEGTLPQHRRFIQALATDNPYTSELYLEQLRNADKITVERLLYGNFEYDDDPAALLDYDAIVDLFSNSVYSKEDKYLIVDVARLGKDKTVLHYWKDRELLESIEYTRQPLDMTAEQIKLFVKDRQIPYSRVLIDEGGVGGGLIDMLKGVKGFLSQAQPTATREGHKNNFDNLKAQCSYKLAELVNGHKLAIKTEKHKTTIIEELQILKARDVDATRYGIITKDTMKELLGRSPDHLDCLIMRMYFELIKQTDPQPLFRQIKTINPNL
jgi:phage terminase large subunit